MAKAKLVKARKKTGVGSPAKLLSVKRLRESDFKSGGLRDFFSYRDLGVKRAVGGRIDAHVVRPERPSDRGGTGRHFHSLDFQMVYCLRGWLTFWYKGKGEVTLKAGDCVYMPPGIHHDLFDWSDDMEFLEVVMPAKYGTTPV